MADEGEMWVVAFSPNGQWVVSGSSDDGTVWVWESGQQKIVLQEHTSPVWSAAYSLDGKWIVTVSNEGTARVWNAEVGSSR